MYISVHIKCPLFLSDLNFLDRFFKILKYQIPWMSVWWELSWMTGLGTVYHITLHVAVLVENILFFFFHFYFRILKLLYFDHMCFWPLTRSYICAYYWYLHTSISPPHTHTHTYVRMHMHTRVLAPCGDYMFQCFGGRYCLCFHSD